MKKEENDTTTYLEHSDTYPYIVLHAMAGVYRIFQESQGTTEIQLIKDAIALSEKWKKGTCAVVAKKKCFFIEPDGTIYESDNIPAGGIILVDPEFESDS